MDKRVVNLSLVIVLVLFISVILTLKTLENLENRSMIYPVENKTVFPTVEVEKGTVEIGKGVAGEKETPSAPPQEGEQFTTTEKEEEREFKIMVDADGDGDDSATDCDDTNASILSPRDNLYINNDTLLCSGTYYLNDTANNGIIIFNASNISVTCNDTVIVGGGGGYGFYANARYNITLTGCNVTTYQRGVYIRLTDKGYISNINSWNSFWGVYLYQASNSTLFNLTTWDSTYEVYVSNSDDCNISAINGMNGTYGLFIDNSDNGVLDTLTFDNTDYGVYFASSTGNNVSSFRSWNNSQTAVYLQSSPSHRITNFNMVNSSTGIQVDAGSQNCVLSTGNISFGYWGLYIAAQDTHASDIDVWNSISDGISVNTANDVVISNVTVGNNYRGAYIRISDRVNISNSIFFNHSQPGIYLDNSNNATIFNITASDNLDGVYIWIGTGHKVINSTLYHNSRGISTGAASTGNLFYHNNFTNNTALQASADSGGNYF
ncbi:MAG: right-handed parallel beta-helix repeat-containing protein, partial [Nanoarchaeota archaeon]|nr:right-handed parallel beta-helix repeat-containing protein [Nanoarchaeota archaeon]